MKKRFEDIENKLAVAYAKAVRCGSIDIFELELKNEIEEKFNISSSCLNFKSLDITYIYRELVRNLMFKETNILFLDINNMLKPKHNYQYGLSFNDKIRMNSNIVLINSLCQMCNLKIIIHANENKDFLHNILFYDSSDVFNEELKTLFSYILPTDIKSKEKLIKNFIANNVYKKVIVLDYEDLSYTCNIHNGSLYVKFNECISRDDVNKIISFLLDS